MTKTENYALPQWEAIDPVRREDFNGAMENIDTAIQSASYAVGTYTGNGLTAEEGGVFVKTGFKPRFVILTRGCVRISASDTTLMTGEGFMEGVDTYVDFQEQGFQVNYMEKYADMYVPLRMNDVGVVYSYAAFR